MGHKGHYGEYSRNAKWSKVTSSNMGATKRDDEAHMDYLKQDVDYDDKHGHSDSSMTADEKHISKLAGDLKYDEKNHGSPAKHKTVRHMFVDDTKSGGKSGSKKLAEHMEAYGVVIAAITSCTNTSNPSVLIAAGLVARKARAKGLTRKPWVKTSLAPGSQVVTDYLNKAGLSEDLDAIGFNLVGYGCTTCIGNSGPLAQPISDAINGNDIVAASVLSGNRNFEGRVSPDVRANFLASPPLVVAYALKGTVTEDMIETPIGEGNDGPCPLLGPIWSQNGPQN